MPDCKATSMFGIMMKSLHKGTSVMISLTPVHKQTASYQLERVKEAAAAVENAGGRGIGFKTDNHKINQQYCKLFNRPSDFQVTATHPLDNNRVWFLLFDPVHLLKWIRNNWISEKCQQISLDDKTTASLADVKELYNSEKGSILKTAPLTQCAVNPSRLQLQNAQYVLRVFNDKVVASLKIKGCHVAANFNQTILNWWNVMNVSKKGQDQRMNDSYRAVQNPQPTTQENFLAIFNQASSGHAWDTIESDASLMTPRKLSYKLCME